MLWLKLTVVIIIVCMEQRLDAQPIISQYSPSVYPGDIFRLHGAGFGSDVQVYARSRNNGNQDTQLTITSHVDDVVTAYIPNNWFMDIYELRVTSNGQDSNIVYANKPISTMTDMSEVLAGGLLRIFGKNLYYPQSGLTPTVTFIDENNVQTSARLDLSSSDSFVLACYAPDGQIDGKKYRIQVDNGYGYPALIDPIVTGRNGKDILGTGVGWTVCFDNYTANTVEFSPMNNASFDDMPRIINTLRSFKNGGILKLKAGEYNVLSCNVQLPSNFILMGEGADKTIIYYGAACPNRTNQFYSFSIDAFAIVDLTLRHVSNNVLGFHNAHGASRQVYLRLNIDLGYSSGAGFGATKGFMSDVNVTSNTAFDNGFVFGGYGWGCSNEFILRRSSFFYESNAMDARLTNNIIFEDNKFIRDQRYQTMYPNIITNFRGLEANFMNNFVFMNNHMETLNYDAYTSNVLTNDGETINHEAGGPKPGRGAINNVTLASSTSITDPSKNFSNMLFQPNLNLAVTIIRGPGMGQVRRVIGAFANGTLAVDRPWNIVPTTNSVYSTSLISSNWLVKDNTFIGWAKGAPELYLGRVTNITVVGNTYLNNGGPYANPSNRFWNGSQTADCISGVHDFTEESYFAGFSHELYFLNNYMYFTDPNNTAQLGVFGNSPGNLNGMGLIASGIELRNNTIIRTGQRRAAYLSNQPDGFYLSICNDDINGAVAQGNKLVGTSGFLLDQQTGTVLACTSIDSLVTNLTSIRCNIGAERVVGLSVVDVCSATNFQWIPPVPPSARPSMSSSVQLLLNLAFIFVLVLSVAL